MKLYTMICGSLMIMNSLQANGQEEYHLLSVGGSAGKGYAVDLSYGRRVTNPGELDHGADLLFSIWTPDYRFPIPFDKTREVTADDFVAGAYVESSKDCKLGFGMGARYSVGMLAGGFMFDLITINHFDYYRNPADNSLSQTRNDITVGGWTGEFAVRLIDKLTGDGFYGTRRGINVGVAWNIVNP